MTVRSYANDITVETRLLATNCYECGVVYGMGAEFRKARKGDQRTFYCPNGHAAYFPGSALSSKRPVRWPAGSGNAASRPTGPPAPIGVASTRVKNRAAHGVCPVPGCKRSFANVARHVAGQHPDFASEHGTTTGGDS